MPRQGGCQSGACRYDFKLPPLLTDEDIETSLQGRTVWSLGVDSRNTPEQAVSVKEGVLEVVEGVPSPVHNEAAVEQAVTRAAFDPYERKLLGHHRHAEAAGKTRLKNFSRLH
jgi:hypothetical protein